MILNRIGVFWPEHSLQAGGRRFETCTAHQPDRSNFKRFLQRDLRLSLNKATPTVTFTFDSHRSPDLGYEIEHRRRVRSARNRYSPVCSEKGYLGSGVGIREPERKSRV